MTNKFAGKGFLLLLVLPLSFTVASAEDAEVLPKGVFMAKADGYFYIPFDTRYNQNGDTESLAVNYNGNLNSTVFPDLRALEQPNLPPPLGLPPGTASIGTSVVHYEYDAQILWLTLGYGITDRLTAGVRVPYFMSFRNNVTAQLDNSTATVGKNPFLNSLAPLGVPGTTPLTTNDVQNLLGTGLDINGDGIPEIPGYGYKRVESWEGHGFGDLEAGVKYKYLQTDTWRLAAGCGLLFPTGKIDDPDSIVDYGFGLGAFAPYIRLHNDLMVGKSLVLNATFSYYWYLPDKVELRVPANVDQGITRNKENVDRNLGDVFNAEFSGTYYMNKAFSGNLMYRYGRKSKDEVSGNMGFNYSSLEDETNYVEHVYAIGLSYSTVPLYVEKKFLIPMSVNVGFRSRFAGKNNVFQSDYFNLGLAFFF